MKIIKNLKKNIKIILNKMKKTLILKKMKIKFLKLKVQIPISLIINILKTQKISKSIDFKDKTINL